MLNEKIIHEENLHIMKREVFTSKYSYNEDQLDSSEECDNGGMNFIILLPLKMQLQLTVTHHMLTEEFERLCGSKIICYENVSIFYSCQ